MTKIMYNGLRLQKNVILPLNNSKIKLSSILRNNNNLNIPLDFKYLNYLKNLNKDLNECLKMISNMESSLDFGHSLLQQSENNLANRINNIEIYSISLRQSAIK